MRRVAVEGFAADALALARRLADDGDDVRLVGVDPPAIVDLPVVAAIPETVDVAYLDVWTAEVDDRVRRLRERGAQVSCLSDLLLERASVPAIGVTGTAGKSTTASFVVQLLRRLEGSGRVYSSTTARSGNLWATEESLAVLDVTDGTHVLELTSSHLAFMSTSPHVAVITSFWPDHLELHGSLAAYRAAKERIVRRQRRDDHVVVNADDPAAVTFADVTPATVHRFSSREAVGRGVFVVDGRVVAAPDEVDLGAAGAGSQGQALLAAAAAVIASGVEPERLVGQLDGLEAPAGRARELGRVRGTILIDDTMAATPGKTRAALGAFGPGEVVLVAGGELEVGGRAVHATPEERAELALAVADIRGTAAHVVCFGPAGERLAEAIGAGTATTLVPTIDDAVGVALECSAGARALVVSPMHPLSPADRERVAELLVAARE